MAVLLMGGALLGKVLGLVREIMVAHAIGASVIADSFRGGLTAVMLPLGFIQNESVPAILIPAYREWQENGDAARRFAALTVALVLVSACLAAVVEISAPAWIGALVAGFGPEAHETTLRFTRVMALAMPGSVLATCLSAAEIARGRSRITLVRSTALNLAVIGGLVLFTLTGRAESLAWAFAAAFNAIAGWALWMLLRDGSVQVAGTSIGDVFAGGREFFRRLRPLLIQPVTEYGQVWIERLLASGLVVGTLASLDYARTITDCAVLLVAQPIGLAVLSAGPSRDSKAQMEMLAGPVLAIALPISVFLAAFAPELVELVFHRGAFDQRAVGLTSSLLAGIATGLWATTLGYILLRMLNSAGRNARATMIIAAAYSANALTSLLLIDRFGIVALGLGEAVRGGVLLTGVALALGCGGRLLRLLLMAAPGTAILIAAEILVRAHVTGVLPRLFYGGCLCSLAVALSLGLLVPTARDWAKQSVRRLLGRVR